MIRDDPPGRGVESWCSPERKPESHCVVQGIDWVHQLTLEAWHHKAG